jgi:hypothetical protein
VGGLVVHVLRISLTPVVEIIAAPAQDDFSDNVSLLNSPSEVSS